MSFKLTGSYKKKIFWKYVGRLIENIFRSIRKRNWGDLGVDEWIILGRISRM